MEFDGSAPPTAAPWPEWLCNGTGSVGRGALNSYVFGARQRLSWQA